MKRYIPNDFLQNAIVELHKTEMISTRSIIELAYFGENDEQLAQEILEVKESNRHYRKKEVLQEVQKWLDLYHQYKN